MSKLEAKLKKLPKSPGVYFFKDANERIIYIGKASQLARRVKSYFQKTHTDYKTPLLVEHIADVDWIEAGSEIEALFLEAEFIKRHKPLYNVQEKDDKNYLYVKVTMQDDFPTVLTVRRPSDDKARYFGPFIHGYEVRKALRYLRRIFPYYIKTERKLSSKLEYQIGVAPRPDISRAEYRAGVNRLIMVLEGKTKTVLHQQELEMKRLAAKQDYEKASMVRNQYLALKALSTKMIFGRDETFDLTLDKALRDLAELLGLAQPPRRMECYDISNFAGGDAVSSMVVFTDGVPDQKSYRHFRMRSVGPNDFAMMAETMRRRFSTRHQDWPKPDLVIIDGGKGQLSSARAVLHELDIDLPMIGLAKRYETIVQPVDQAVPKSSIHAKTEGEFVLLSLDHSDEVLQLLQRIRDEAHRFAVSYHTLVRKKRTKTSELDAIAGVGPATRKKLVRSFGSVVGVKEASEAELSAVVGPSKARQIITQLR